MWTVIILIFNPHWFPHCFPVPCHYSDPRCPGTPRYPATSSRQNLWSRSTTTAQHDLNRIQHITTCDPLSNLSATYDAVRWSTAYIFWLWFRRTTSDFAQCTISAIIDSKLIIVHLVYYTNISFYGLQWTFYNVHCTLYTIYCTFYYKMAINC